MEKSRVRVLAKRLGRRWKQARKRLGIDPLAPAFGALCTSALMQPPGIASRLGVVSGMAAAFLSVSLSPSKGRALWALALGAVTWVVFLAVTLWVLDGEVPRGAPKWLAAVVGALRAALSWLLG